MAAYNLINDFRYSKSPYHCEMTTSYFVTEEGRIVKVYGIDLYNIDPDMTDKPNESCRLDGISDEKQKVTNLIKLIRDLDVHPVHLFT